MNPPKYTAIEYINFLIATSISLWEEARESVKLKGGILVVDDSVLDKTDSSRAGTEFRHRALLYAKKMALGSWQWCGMHPPRGSGKHGQVVKGINLTTLLWTDGDKHIPCDYRLY